MKTIREYIDQLDEISRRDFLKGTGAAAGLAAVGSPKDAVASSYQLTEDDYVIIGLANYIISYINLTGGNKGVLGMLKESLQEVSGFLGYPVEKNYDQKVQDMLKTSPQSRITFDRYSQVEDGIKLANRIGSIRNNLIRGMSAEERRYHMNRLGIKEEQLEETSEDPIAKIDALFRNK
jgi:hypothetical protein